MEKKTYIDGVNDARRLLLKYVKGIRHYLDRHDIWPKGSEAYITNKFAQSELRRMVRTLSGYVRAEKAEQNDK